MRSFGIAAVAAALFDASNGAAIKTSLTLETDLLAASSYANLGAYVLTNGPFSKDCSLDNVAVRKEWCVICHKPWWPSPF